MTTPIDYPICLRLEGRRVLLVGGGTIAEGRALAVLEAGGLLRLVSPEATPTLRQLAAEGRLEWEARPYAPGDVRGHHLVLAAADDPSVGPQVAEEARAQGIWVNTADVPHLCDFNIPSVGRRGPITVAISTAGHAPAVARLLRRQLTARIAPHHVWLARLCGWLRRHLPAGVARQRFLKGLVEGDVGALLARGERKAASVRLRAELKNLKSSGETT